MKAKIISISYTFQKNDKQFSISYQAELEDWENEKESIDFLKQKCLQAAEEAGFNTKTDSGEELEGLINRNQELAEKIESAQDTFRKIANELNVYEEDIASVTAIHKAINNFNLYEVGIAANDFKNSYEHLADHRQNLQEQINDFINAMNQFLQENQLAIPVEYQFKQALVELKKINECL
ncbi:hypothetical protein PCC9214_05364 [Planktothrix tepida]|uniref:Uncharacterized protein n=1 Tax=Planktothrix tepida PCC 9214 TaxID=671072 RepID=A0A1J1LIS8_9CYAN|nr:hypothetical protein [Planktothrix tepida]CAD5984986.1 hypothetical protein PCC9214_05326 [Planktothrix tepida]CAD5985270.1 hypothetical protein PCC9214_05364 [Planktothrix tepida]CUR32126.1 hypothetical protein PL9214430098 [Planktothrix tepida PCC 9214]